MDSLPEGAKETLEGRGCQFLVRPRAKDETDLELALTYAAEQGVDEIIVLGALGGRLDHAIANVLLLVLPKLEGILIRIIDGAQEAQLLRSGDAVSVLGRPGDLISLIPLAGNARGVSATGLAWVLQGETLQFGFTRGVSNVMIADEARIEIDDGLLLILHRPPEEEQNHKLASDNCC
jgi:thiamine pyrophosphokinase